MLVYNNQHNKKWNRTNEQELDLHQNSSSTQSRDQRTLMKLGTRVILLQSCKNKLPISVLRGQSQTLFVCFGETQYVCWNQPIQFTTTTIKGHWLHPRSVSDVLGLDFIRFINLGTDRAHRCFFQPIRYLLLCITEYLNE